MNLRFLPLRLLSWLLWAAWLGATSPAAWAQEGLERYTCPIDGAQTFPIGNDGKVAPQLATDLEIPSRAYTNLVVACPVCGYAAWTGEFERAVDPGLGQWVQQSLKATAPRAGNEPAYAYEHLVRILRQKKASSREQMGAMLYWSYVLKRKRPRGGGDALVERPLLRVRVELSELIATILRDDPPRTDRPRLELLYLTGELSRLAGQTERAAILLADVCKHRDQAGRTVGQMACSQAERALKGETIEEYRDGMVDGFATVQAAIARERSVGPPGSATATGGFQP